MILVYFYRFIIFLYNQSLYYALLILLQLFLYTNITTFRKFIRIWITLIRKSRLKIHPSSQNLPYLILLLKILKLINNLFQYPISCPYRLSQISKTTCTYMLSLLDLFKWIFRLHSLFYSRIVFFMLDIGFFYLVELLFVRLEVFKWLFIE